MKKIGILVVLMLGLFVLMGCENDAKIESVDHIKKEDIFNQEEDRYFVYFHRVECPDCESSKPTLIQYEMIRQDVKACGDKRKVYSVLLYTPLERPNDDVHIYREYTREGGQGTDEKYFVDNVTSWDELYIASTSSLISIETNSKGEKFARYAAQGAEAVVEYLTKQLGECYNK